jgi:hypothetical protein
LLPTASSKIQETTQDNNNIPSTTTHSQPRPHAEESSSGSSDEEDSVSGQEENESVGDAAEVNSRTIQLTEVERAPTFEENQVALYMRNGDQFIAVDIW